VIFCGSKTLDQFLESLQEAPIQEVKEKSNNKILLIILKIFLKNFYINKKKKKKK